MQGKENKKKGQENRADGGKVSPPQRETNLNYQLLLLWKYATNNAQFTYKALPIRPSFQARTRTRTRMHALLDFARTREQIHPVSQKKKLDSLALLFGGNEGCNFVPNGSDGVDDFSPDNRVLGHQLVRQHPDGGVDLLVMNLVNLGRE